MEKKPRFFSFVKSIFIDGGYLTQLHPVPSPKSIIHLDYILICGNASNVWQDCFIRPDVKWQTNRRIFVHIVIFQIDTGEIQFILKGTWWVWYRRYIAWSEACWVDIGYGWSRNLERKCVCPGGHRNRLPCIKWSCGEGFCCAPPPTEKIIKTHVMKLCITRNVFGFKLGL